MKGGLLDGGRIAKELTTQCMVVLLKDELQMDELERSLVSFPGGMRRPPHDDFEYGGPSLLVPFRPEVNGYVSVEIVNHPWPDREGDPKTEKLLVASWILGFFGPLTFPGALQRAGQHSLRWEPGRTIAKRHTGYVKLLSSYAYGTGQKAALRPPDYDPGAELMFMTDMTLEVLRLSQALCYFNPGGELLMDREGLQKRREFGLVNDNLPIDAWMSCRIFRTDTTWMITDTVGNGQLGVTDVEACFTSRYDWQDVGQFLRNASWAFYENGETVKEGDTAAGPGGISWQAVFLEAGVSDPPRRVIRWMPLDSVPVPKPLQKSGRRTGPSKR